MSMLKSTKQLDDPARPELGLLLQRATVDGKRWMAAELTLARAELGDLRRRCVTAAIFALVALAALLCALLILAEAGVAAAALYLGSEIGGGIAIGALFLVVAFGCLVVMALMFKWKPESLFFSWMRKRT